MAVVYADLADVTQRYALGLSIEGCPYLFTTGGVASYAFTGDRDADWTRDVAEWTVLSGWLDVSDGLSWTERVMALQGDVEVSGITFRIHDKAPTTGPAAGFPVMSWLCTREDVASTPLAASIEAQATTMTVEDGSIFGSADFPVWVDREAMWCTSRTGNTLTLDIADTVRGVYGSLNRAHIVDADTRYAPEVYPAFPFLERRRAILWMAPVDAAGAFTDPVPLWRGYVATGAPRLASDGARWELFCDSVTALLGDVTIGVPPVACTVAGYSTSTTYGAFSAFVDGRTNGGVSFHGGGLMQSCAPGTTPRYYDSLAELCADLNDQITAQLAAAGVTSSVHVTANGRTVRLWGNVGDGKNMTTWLHLGMRVPVGDSVNTVTDSATGDLAEASIDNVPLAIASVGLSQFEPVAVRMASVAGLPTTGWPYGEPPDSARRTVLTATAGDYRLELIPIADDIIADTVVDVANRTVRGYLRLYRGTGTSRIDLDGSEGIADLLAIQEGYAFLLAPLTFRAATTIDTTLWAQGLQDLVSNDGVPLGGTQVPTADLDYRDWSWSRIHRIAAAVPAALARRHWLFDGTQDVRSVLVMNEQFSGGAPGIRRSRIAPDVFVPATRTDVYDADHTFTCGGGTYLERPGFIVAPDGIANSVSARLADATGGGSTTWVLQDQRSVARFGPRKLPDGPMEVRGLEVTAEMLAQGPRALQQYLTSRVMALWSVPVKTAKVHTTLARLDTVYLMDNVRVDADSFLPNASGDRGWDGVGATVIGREVKLVGGSGGVDGKITFELMHWPYNALGGWAPCARVATSVASTKAITVASAYLPTAGTGYDDLPKPADYAGSNRTGYANADLGAGTVAFDGGTGLFPVGAQVELILRDATGDVHEFLEVATVDPATRTITFTTTQSAAWALYILAGYLVDLRPVRDYEAVTTEQQRYAFVGDRASHAIESNSDHPNFRWSP